MALLIGFVTFTFLIFWSFIMEFWQRAATQESQVRHLEELRFHLQPWWEIPKGFLDRIRWRRQ